MYLVCIYPIHLITKYTKNEGEKKYPVGVSSSQDEINWCFKKPSFSCTANLERWREQAALMKKKNS